METLSEQRCFGGTQGFYRMESRACAGPMEFGVFVPPKVARVRVPALYWLAGLTCTPETFLIKAGAQRVAAELGLMLIAPDTSPRHTGIDGATGDWEFGEGAGFYLDATQSPWSSRFNMETHVVDELPRIIAERFPCNQHAVGIFGHSMGGHGALTLALRHPDRYASASALAPIVAPTKVPWGQKAFSRYLGADQTAWREHDTCELIRDGKRFHSRVLIDQGGADPFLHEQLQVERIQEVCSAVNQPLTLRIQPGYDHSYWFVQSFVEDHLRYHARMLMR